MPRTDVQTVLATLDMAGPQRVGVAAHHARTPQAYLAVTLGRSVIYLHSRPAAERIGEVWQDASAWALQLATRRPPSQPGPISRPPTPGAAEPSLVVHTDGIPPAVAQLIREPGTHRPYRLSIAVGSVRFLVADQLAFTSCRDVFVRAADLADTALCDQPAQPSLTSHAPSLSGMQAERATEQLAGGPLAFRWFGADAARTAAAAMTPARRPGTLPSMLRSSSNTSPTAAPPPPVTAERRRLDNTSRRSR